MEKKEKDVLKNYLFKSKHDFFWIGVYSFFINLFMLLPSIYMLAVYDIAIPASSVETLMMISSIVFLLFLIGTGVQWVREKVLVRLNNQIDQNLNQKVVDCIFKFSVKHPSLASTQAFSDFQQVKNFISSATLFALFDMPWIPIYLLVLYLFHPDYFWFSLGIIFFGLLFALLNEVSTREYLNRSNNSLSKSNRSLSGIVSNSEVIQALGMRQNIYRKWSQIYREYLYNFQVANDKNAFWSNLSKNFRLMSQSFILGLGGYLAIKGEITGGMIVAGSIVLSRALAPIDVLISTWKNFSSFRFSYRRLNALLLDFDKDEEFFKLPPPQGHIRLVGVTVVPPGGKKPTLLNVTMEINPGEVVVLIGPSGAGKSTLIKAITGIWEVYSGSVEIDGASIKQWDKDYLGSFIGYLPQDIELFEGTVAENISRFEENPREEDILHAAMLSGAHQTILKMPDGYSSYVAPGGVNLSGGQRQKIGLARAVYKSPRIVILDEPNSNLDEAGEIALLNMLLNLKQRKVTTIVISHKLNILQVADKVGMLVDGKLVLYGDTASVIERLKAQSREAQ